MKTYFLDTNVLLRFFLKDDLKHFKLAEKYLLKAREGRIKLIVIPEVVHEIEYVLRKVYGLKKDQMVGVLTTLLGTSYIKFENKEIVIKTLSLFSVKSVDFADAYLFAYANSKKAKVLSFDQDFKKLV